MKLIPKLRRTPFFSKTSVHLAILKYGVPGIQAILNYGGMGIHAILNYGVMGNHAIPFVCPHASLNRYPAQGAGDII